MYSRWRRLHKSVFILFIFIIGVLTGYWLPECLQKSYIPVEEPAFVKQSAEWSRGYFDETGKFKVLPYVFQAEQWGQLSQDEGSICAGVQSSLDHAAWLPRFVASWEGPVSFALFAPGPEFYFAIDFIEYLTFCFPNIKRQVSFHLIHPTNLPPAPNSKRTPQSKHQLQQMCSSFTPVKLLKKFGLKADLTTASPRWREELQYPQNVLRNVAREHCQTYWVTTPDIDMLFPRPSPDFKPSIYNKLSEFLVSSYTSQCRRCAYVIPVYEIREHTEYIPKDKAELLSFIKNNQSRQYHVEIFKQNQELSNLDRWESLNGGNEIYVAYTVDKFEFYYEPIYIAKRGTPRFDERFLGYGMVRNTQAYELHLAGYTFHVLDNIFLGHWGYRHTGELPEIRVNQTAHNSERFCQFYLQELQAKYKNYKFPPRLLCV